MKKKVIIVSHNMRIGGVERSLLGLLDTFDYSRYEVDLFLYIHDGELYDLIPKEVNILPEIDEYKSWLLPSKMLIKSGRWKILFAKLKATLQSKIFVKKNNLGANNLVYPNYLHKYMEKNMPVISNKEYDLCISFLTPHYWAATKAFSKKKISWIHTDYSYFEFDGAAEINMWKRYDYIASISDQSRVAFLSKFPSLADKTITIENILSRSFILKQAAEPIEAFNFNPDYINLCSVGRFTEAKNFDNIPYICKLLVKFGYKIRWYLIGFGGDRALIEEKIKENGMEDHVIILGKKDNPYPYIKACDMYIQPSRFEGKSVAVREAQMLEKVVVITDYSTSGSQLADGVDGVIVHLENDACAKGIAAVIDDKLLQERLINNCSTSDYSNADEIKKIYNLIADV